VDGLKEEVKSVVLVQRPLDLNTAYTLALLHEEMDSARRQDSRHAEYLFKPRSTSLASPLPLPPPPPKTDKPMATAVLDRKVTESV
jgi:hypothetical protein